ncbi:hypothetical protein FKM82_008203 [Ascaphus truei]
MCNMPQSHQSGYITLLLLVIALKCSITKQVTKSKGINDNSKLVYVIPKHETWLGFTSIRQMIISDQKHSIIEYILLKMCIE